METFIIYHKADLDWLFWAWACVQDLDGIVVFEPMQYWDKINLEPMRWADVRMVDFSLPREDMERLNENTNSFIRLDHHISAMNEMDDMIIAGERDTKKAWCLLAYDFFWCGDYRHSLVIDLISDYDIRKKSDIQKWDDEILPFQYWTRLDVWLDLDRVFDFMDKISEDDIHDIIWNGKAVVRSNAEMYKKRCNKAWEIEFDWHNCIALFWPSWVSSLVFDSVYDKKIHDMMVYIRYSIKDKEYTISLYSETIDCSIVAKKYWGGWHKWASWFMCKKLPFDI